jgi:superfamily II DNA or RNA helicase
MQADRAAPTIAGVHSPDELDALLLRHLGQVVPRRTRVKAHEYFASGAVDLHEASAARVVATVQGGERYRVALECRQVAGEGRWYGSCSCPAFGRFGPCKHLYAAALEAAQRGLIGGDGRAAAPRSDEPTGWRRALADTAERFARSRRDPWLGVVAHARLVYSLVDRAGRAGLEVRTSDAAALPSGVDWRRLGDELDRAVLARLSGDAGTQLGEVIALDAARAEAVLPLLARAGRLEFAGETLRHSDGGAVQLALRLEPHGADVVLAAGLAHDDTWCELEDNGAWPAIGFAVAEDRLVRLSARASDAAVLDVARKGGIAAPAREANELRALAARAGLPGLGPRVEETLPRGVRLELEAVRVAHHGTPGSAHHDAGMSHAVEIDARIEFRYGATWVRASDPSETVPLANGEQRRRSPDVEARVLALFLAAGGLPAAPQELARRDGSVPRERLDAVLGEALERDWELDLAGLPQRLPDEVSVDVREVPGADGGHELVLDGFARFGARRLSLAELLAAAPNGRIDFADGTSGLLPGALRRALVWAARLGRTANGRVYVDVARGWFAAPLLAGLGAPLPESVRRARAAFDGSEAPPPPRTFALELRPYQLAALAWFAGLERLGLGGCLADDMGLGKTVQVLARLVQRKEQGLADGPSLVVAPLSVVHHWSDLARRAAPTLTVAEFTGGRRDLEQARRADVVFTSYGTLRRDAELFASTPWDVVVLDESQNVKNAASQVSAAARALQSRVRLALSGTPIENHLGELAALMAFLNPGLLGPRAAALEKLSDERSAKDLMAALGPVFLRRTKDEVLAELPPRTEDVLWCELEGEQLARYEALRQRAREELQLDDAKGPALFTNGSSSANVLTHLLRLRQAACHVGLLDDTLTDVPSAKFEVLLPRLELLAREGRKTLVFSQFTSLLHKLPPLLDARRIRYELLDGDTRNRAARVERFQTDPSVHVFLVALKAGGTGLDLSAADTVFLLDPWWNPAAERQAIDRAHRHGQTRPVFAYRLIARGTVEERVKDLAASKGALLEDLFANENLGRLDKATLEGLLRG